jgi:small subunit ribosomal protein S9
MPGNPYGLPPLDEILSFDPDAEARTERREGELAKQHQAAAARVRTVDDQGRAYATGKRKCAVARVWLQPGTGAVRVNGRAFDVYFADPGWRSAALYPFLATQTLGAFDANVHVHGGGSSGQAQAVRHGIAKALQCWAPQLRAPLRELGLLTRDPRVVERKKPGKAKARKSYQWVKR